MSVIDHAPLAHRSARRAWSITPLRDCRCRWWKFLITILFDERASSRPYESKKTDHIRAFPIAQR